MIRTRWSYCCLFVIAVATSAHAATFFVDADLGDDSNSGTSASSPFATIKRAIAEAADTPGPDTIRIASGEYVEKLKITDNDKLTLTGSGDTVVIGTSGSKYVIKIEAGDVTISNMTITGSKDGIKAEPGEEGDTISLTLRDVVVTGNADEGLQAENVTSVTIVGGTFSGNADDGIKVEVADAVTITGATVSDNGGDGIDLEVIGTIKVTRLTVDGNGDEGLEVDDSGSVLVVQGTYSNNEDEGLDIDNTLSIRLVSVVSTGNVGSGFQVEADKMEIESVSVVASSFLGNGEDGIQIVEDGFVVHKVTLTNITATGNVKSGLKIDVSGSVRVTNITSEENGEDDILP